MEKKKRLLDINLGYIFIMLSPLKNPLILDLKIAREKKLAEYLIRRLYLEEKTLRKNIVYGSRSVVTAQ